MKNQNKHDLVAFKTDALDIEEYIVVVPRHWIHLSRRINSDLFAMCDIPDPSYDWAMWFYPNCVDLSDLDSIHAMANTLYTLFDCGDLNKNCAEAFGPTEVDDVV